MGDQLKTAAQWNAERGATAGQFSFVPKRPTESKPKSKPRRVVEPKRKVRG